MYFFYFDESGSRDPDPSVTNQDGATEHVYVLTALGMWENYWKRFDRDIANVKLELADHLFRSKGLRFNLADCEVKSNWIRSPKARAEKSPFLEALTVEDRERLVTTFFNQVAQLKLVLFAVVVDKRKLHDHITHETLHKKAYELLLERIEHFMAEYHPRHNAVVVMDNTEKNLNQAVAMKHAFFQREGNQNVRFRHIIEYPFFTESNLSNGVQLADLCGYNIYRAFKRADLKYPYFQMLLPHFYRRSQGKQLDGLKVFPGDSELVAPAAACWQEIVQKASPAGFGEA